MDPEHEPADALDRALTELIAERDARRRERALVRAGQALTATLELGEVLRIILGQLRLVVPYDTASVQELRDGLMVIVGGDGIDFEFFEGMGFDASSDRRPNGVVAQTRAPVIVDDILGDHGYPDFPVEEHKQSGARAWMGVPLLFGEECIGMLTLDAYEPGFYTDDHARTALEFASQAAIALENARAYARIRHEVDERRRAEEELRQANEALRRRMSEIEALQETLREQAVRDPLTGLFNRRYLMEVLDREVARCRHGGLPLSIALVDVDEFKAVNDTRGHQAGDDVLVAVGHYLRSQVRASDVACRYGGEEFVVLLPDTSLEVASRRAEEWRVAVSEMCPGQGERPVTISVGVAAVSAPDDTGEDVLRAADAAMYEAKAGGRDRVVTAGPADDT